MTEAHDKVGALLRFIASGGMAEEDPDVVRELLMSAHHLAAAVIADPNASPSLRDEARAFLESLRVETYADYSGEKPS